MNGLYLDEFSDEPGKYYTFYHNYLMVGGHVALNSLFHRCQPFYDEDDQENWVEREYLMPKIFIENTGMVREYE